MVEAEEKAQRELRGIADRWETDVTRLREIHAGLPVSAREEAMLLGEADADVSTEVRAAIECVIPDRLEPAIRTLREAAAYHPEGEK